ESIDFYQNKLGLSLKRKYNDMVIFEQGLILVLYSYSSKLKEKQEFKSLIYVRTNEIEKRYADIKNEEGEIVTSLSNWSKTNIQFFRCIDPDGNIVEVFPSEPKGSLD